ncbi:hypothetical protein H0H93_015672, partial [Arthromyces matolae]
HCLTMKFAIPAAILSLAGLVASTVVPRSCAQAQRFGDLTISPSTVNPGDELSINVDFNCAVSSFGIVPVYMDYSISVPAAVNNGHEPNIVLARHNWTSGSTSDDFTVQIPYANYFANAGYEITLTITYPLAGTDGSQYLVQGGTEAPITIN